MYSEFSLIHHCFIHQAFLSTTMPQCQQCYYLQSLIYFQLILQIFQKGLQWINEYSLCILSAVYLYDHQYSGYTLRSIVLIQVVMCIISFCMKFLTTFIIITAKRSTTVAILACPLIALFTVRKQRTNDLWVPSISGSQYDWRN